jgi:sporulation protein YlmC with PRC-barrel domain
MITRNDIEQVSGADVYASEGDKIGSVVQVYLDDQSGAPEWVSVRTSLFGRKETFVPLGRATLNGDRLDVSFGKAQVKDAP